MPHPSLATPSRLLGAPAGELKFRIQGGEHHGRVLRITAAKCSIGSAAGCTLRLNGEGIEPLHCWILSGKNATIIRRNSQRTYLNGGAFEDAALHAGDILRLGPVEMKVISCPHSAGPAEPPRSLPTLDAGYFEQTAKVEQRIADEVSRVRDQENAEHQRLAQELFQATEQLGNAREQLAGALQQREQAALESQQATQQLREQYAQGLERFLLQQQHERAESTEREEVLREEWRLAKETAEQLLSRLAEQERATEQQVRDHQHLVERLQEELRGEQALRQQEREQVRTGTTEQIHQLETQLGAARQETELRAADYLAQQQRANEEFTAVRRRLEGSISGLTEQLQRRETELAASHQRGGECAETLTFALDDARQELRELQVQHNQQEEQRTSYRKQLEGQLADLTTRLIDRERVLVQRDQQFAELQQRFVHLAAADQIVRHLEESLASAISVHQDERNSWLAEKATFEVRVGDLEAMQRQEEPRRIALENQCNSLEVARGEAETKLNDLQVQHGELHVRYDNLEGQLGALQTDFSVLQSERGDLEARLNQAQDGLRSRDEMEGQLANLRGSLEQVAAQEAVQHAAREEAIRRHEEQVERWQSEAHQWQLRAEEAACQLAPLNERCLQLEADLERVRLEATSHVGSAEEERNNLADTRSQLETQQLELTEARAQFQEEQARQQQLLHEAGEREVALVRQEAEQRERESAWVIARAEQAGLLEERAQRIISQIAHFEAEQAAFAQQQATIIQQMSTLEDRVHHLTTASDGRTTNSPFVIPRLDDPALLNDLEKAEEPYVRGGPVPMSEVAQAEDVQNPSIPSGELTSEATQPEPKVDGLGDETDTAASRVVESGENQAVVPQESHIDPPVLHVAPQAHENSFGALKNDEDEDDSIEEYMNRLLSRVRGDDSSAGIASVSQSVPSAFAESASTRTPVKSDEVTSEPKEYVPRVHVPEPSERLSLMRALANTAAESAIQAHARQSQKRETRRRSLIALVSLFGATCLFAAGFQTGSTLAFIGSLALVASCCIMSMRAISSSLRRVELATAPETAKQAETATVPPQSEPAEGSI